MAIAMPATAQRSEDALDDNPVHQADAIDEFYRLFDTIPVQVPSAGYLIILRYKADAYDPSSDTGARAHQLLGHFGFAERIKAMSVATGSISADKE